MGEGNGTLLHYSCLENPMGRGAWWAAVHGVAKSRTRLSDLPFTFHFHALEKEIATHSSVLAWRIPVTGEPGGLPSLGSHRVGHYWSDLAAAAANHFMAGDLELEQSEKAGGWGLPPPTHSSRLSALWEHARMLMESSPQDLLLVAREVTLLRGFKLRIQSYYQGVCSDFLFLHVFILVMSYVP